MTTTKSTSKFRAGQRVKSKHNEEARGLVLAVKMWKNGQFRYSILLDGQNKPHSYGESFWERES